MALDAEQQQDAANDTLAASRMADQLVNNAVPSGTSATPPIVGGAPSAPVAPTTRTLSTGSFSDRLGAALQEGVGTDAGKAAANAPGGLMRMILASAADALAKPKPAPGPTNAQRFITGVEKFIAPLSEMKGSALSGAGDVAKADLAQKEADRKQAIENQERMTRDDRERLQLGLTIAQANMSMTHSQYLLHKDMEQERDKNISDGKEALEHLKQQPVPGVVVGEGLNSDQLNQMIQQHTEDIKNGVRADQARGFDPTQMTAFATGKVQVGTDANGTPQYRNTYTLVRLPDKFNFTSKEQFMTLGKYLFKDASNKDLSELASHIDAEHPLVVAGADYNSAFQARETSNAITAAAQKAADEAAIGQRERSDKVESMDFRGNDVWAQDLGASIKRHPDWSYPEQVIEAYRTMQSHPPLKQDGSKMYPNLEEDIATAFGEKNLSNMQKEAEQARHDREQERINNKRADAAAARAQKSEDWQKSYNTQIKRLDADRKLIEPKLGEFSNLQTLLDANNAQADAEIAPMLLKALVAGGGVRITQAEINLVTHGRSTLGDIQAWGQKLINGKKLAPEQRQQIHDLARIMQAKVAKKAQLLEDAEDFLADTDHTANEQQAFMGTMHRAMGALDGVESPEQTPGQDAAKQGMATTKQAASNANDAVVNVPDGKGGTVAMTFKNKADAEKFKLQHGIK